MGQWCSMYLACGAQDGGIQLPYTVFTLFSCFVWLRPPYISLVSFGYLFSFTPWDIFFVLLLWKKISNTSNHTIEWAGTWFAQHQHNVHWNAISWDIIQGFTRTLCPEPSNLRWKAVRPYLRCDLHVGTWIMLCSEPCSEQKLEFGSDVIASVTITCTAIHDCTCTCIK